MTADVALPGEVVGGVAFALGSTYQTTVVCLRRARVLLVAADSLRRVLERCSGALSSRSPRTSRGRCCA